jgi:hypothetical protein
MRYCCGSPATAEVVDARILTSPKGILELRENAEYFLWSGPFNTEEAPVPSLRGK